MMVAALPVAASGAAAGAGRLGAVAIARALARALAPAAAAAAAVTLDARLRGSGAAAVARSRLLVLVGHRHVRTSHVVGDAVAATLNPQPCSRLKVKRRTDQSRAVGWSGGRDVTRGYQLRDLSTGDGDERTAGSARTSRQGDAVATPEAGDKVGFLLRLPASTHQALKAWADEHGHSMNVVVRVLVEHFLDERSGGRTASTSTRSDPSTRVRDRQR